MPLTLQMKTMSWKSFSAWKEDTQRYVLNLYQIFCLILGQASPVKTGAKAQEVGRLEFGTLAMQEERETPHAARQGTSNKPCTTRQVRKKSFAVEAACEEPISLEVAELVEPLLVRSLSCLVCQSITQVV